MVLPLTRPFDKLINMELARCTSHRSKEEVSNYLQLSLIVFHKGLE